MSEELKPCPFCGSTKLKIDKKSVLDRYTGLGVRLERHIQLGAMYVMQEVEVLEVLSLMKKMP